MTTTENAGPLAVINNKQLSTAQRINTVRDVMHAKKDTLFAGIAKVVDQERLIQVTCNCITKNPELLDCDPRTLLSAVSEANTFQWTLDGILGHAHLVPFKEKDRQGNIKKITCQLIPGYKGYRDLVNRCGQVEVLVMESVREGDEFSHDSIVEIPKHRRSKDARRRLKPVTHAYVVAKFVNGGFACDSWSVDEIKAHRDHYSQGWRRYKKDPDGWKAKQSPWHEENPAFARMCEKTVLLHMIHRGDIPMSVEHRQYASREVETVIDDAPTPMQEFDLLPEPDQAGSFDELVERVSAANTLKDINEAWKELEEGIPEALKADAKKMCDDARQSIRDSRGEGSNK